MVTVLLWKPLFQKPFFYVRSQDKFYSPTIEKGFDKAYVVLGQFLVLKKDEELFQDWLKDTCAANSKQQRDCYSCLKEWCDAFL